MKRSLLFITILASFLGDGESFANRPLSAPYTAQDATCRSKLGLFGPKAEQEALQDSSINNRHSSGDWLYNVRSIPQSTILRDIRNPVVSVAAWSFVVSMVHRVLGTSARPAVRALASHMTIPGTAHSFLVSALGLLLVFRTNSAYQRFLVRFPVLMATDSGGDS